jgi:amphiphysin
LNSCVSSESNDPEFDEHSRNFGTLETATDKLLKESKAFIESCNCNTSPSHFIYRQADFFGFVAFFTTGAEHSANFASMFKPLKSEYDLAGKYPDALHTIKNVDAHRDLMEELKGSVQPELELIKGRIMGPTMEFKEVLKSVRKSITKRDHKVCSSSMSMILI